jgi:hypothetical protein
MSKKSLCFREAYDAHKEGDIGQEECLRHMVAHYGGLRHPEDAQEQKPYLPSFLEDRLLKHILYGNFAPLDEESAYIFEISFSLPEQEH